MKIKMFILVDSGDSAYKDLITFKEYVKFEDVYNAINKAKEEKAGEYTNEDMYTALDTLGVDYEMVFLFDTPEIEY